MPNATRTPVEEAVARGMEYAQSRYKTAAALGATDQSPGTWKSNETAKPQAATLTESTTLTEAAGKTAKTGRMHVHLITPGWGSSGHYSEQVLETAGKARVFPAGTHMYLDHPSTTEEVDRPERSVRDLAAVLAEDAYWNGQALAADVRVFAPYRDVLDEMADAIGVSIRAAGTAESGEADGRRGLLITSLDEALSVDFVTKAGRGGRIVEVLESARAKVTEARNVGQWLEAHLHRTFTNVADEMFGQGQLTRDERIALSSAIGDGLAAFVSALEQAAPQLYERDPYEQPSGAHADVGEAGMKANDKRDALQDAVRDAHSDAERNWAYVVDHDDTLVYFERNGDETGTFQQGYTIADDGSAALTGDPVEVTVRTTYVPVANPQESHQNVPDGAAAGPTPSTERTTMSGNDTGAAPTTGGTDPTTTAEGSANDAPANVTEAGQQIATLRRQVAEERQRAAGYAEAVTARRQAEDREAAAVEENRRLRGVLAARESIETALSDSQLPDASHARVTQAVLGVEGRALPLTSEGEVDGDSLQVNLTAAIEAERRYLAQVAESLGMGVPRGLGGTGTTSDNHISEADLDAEIAGAFGRTTVKEA